MSKVGVSFEDIKKELMLDEDFKKEYDKLRSRYAIISRIIEESGNYNPILDFFA